MIDHDVWELSRALRCLCPHGYLRMGSLRRVGLDTGVRIPPGWMNLAAQPVAVGGGVGGEGPPGGFSRGRAWRIQPRARLPRKCGWPVFEELHEDWYGVDSAAHNGASRNQVEPDDCRPLIGTAGRRPADDVPPPRATEVRERRVSAGERRGKEPPRRSRSHRARRGAPRVRVWRPAFQVGGAVGAGGGAPGAARSAAVPVWRPAFQAVVSA